MDTVYVVEVTEVLEVTDEVLLRTVMIFASNAHQLSYTIKTLKTKI